MWLWLVSNIAGSLLGTASTAWFQNTKLGIWAYKEYEKIAQWAVDRYGIDILDKEDTAWRTKYPKVAQKIDDLEQKIREIEEKQNGGNKDS